MQAAKSQSSPCNEGSFIAEEDLRLYFHRHLSDLVYWVMTDRGLLRVEWPPRWCTSCCGSVRKHGVHMTSVRRGSAMCSAAVAYCPAAQQPTCLLAALNLLQAADMHL